MNKKGKIKKDRSEEENHSVIGFCEFVKKKKKKKKKKKRGIQKGDT